ncbi:MAG: hypothetical protein AAB373_06755 [Patescibacteria group bacterium]
MAKGKSQYVTWYCTEPKPKEDNPNALCNYPINVTYLDKRRDAELIKVLSKFCPQCRKHTSAKRKDTKKGNG